MRSQNNTCRQLPTAGFCSQYLVLKPLNLSLTLGTIVANDTAQAIAFQQGALYSLARLVLENVSD